jgi:hypothetical protein
MYFIQFSNKSIGNSNIQIIIEDKQIPTVNKTKFLGLIIDNTLSWKGHMEYRKSELSSACYVMRTVKPHVSQNALKII